MSCRKCSAQESATNLFSLIWRGLRWDCSGLNCFGNTEAPERFLHPSRNDPPHLQTTHRGGFPHRGGQRPLGAREIHSARTSVHAAPVVGAATAGGLSRGVARIAIARPLRQGLSGGFQNHVARSPGEALFVWSPAFRRQGRTRPPEGGTPNPRRPRTPRIAPEIHR